MAILVDRNTDIIDVPQADLTFIGGTLYEFDTDQFRIDLKAIEANEEGIVFPDTHRHRLTSTIVGIVYPQIIEMLAPYQVRFTPDAQYSVRLTGSNNNIWDVENNILYQNQVQVIPNNTAGLINQGLVDLEPDGLFVPSGLIGVTINRLTNLISIPRSGLQLVGGTLYELDTDLLRRELKAIEASEEGIVFPDTHTHDTQSAVAGVTYARSLELIAPYSIIFTPDESYTVRLVSSNNNFFDVGSSILVQNQVQVIPTNSLGLQVAAASGGITKVFGGTTIVEIQAQPDVDIVPPVAVEAIPPVEVEVVPPVEVEVPS